MERLIVQVQNLLLYLDVLIKLVKILIVHTNITSLVYCPHTVGGSFYAEQTKITSLSGIHKLVKKINGEFSIDPHYTHILGLLLIPGVSYIEANDQKLTNILNKHLKDKNIILAQDELLEAGFTQQAKL